MRVSAELTRHQELSQDKSTNEIKFVSDPSKYLISDRNSDPVIHDLICPERKKSDGAKPAESAA
jgi:hypothetical protein